MDINSERIINSDRLLIINRTLYISDGLAGKESACNAGATGDEVSVPGLGRSPGGGHGNPLQYSCLENPTDRGAWWATFHGVAKSRTQVNRLSTHAPKA